MAKERLQEAQEKKPGAVGVPRRAMFWSSYGSYYIDSNTGAVDLLNDLPVLLESAQAVIQTLIDGMSNEESAMAANASRDVPALLFGVKHQLEMVGCLADAALGKVAA